MGKSKKMEELTGLQLTTRLLEQKIRDHDLGLCMLSTQELIKIHEALVKDRPTGEFLFMTVVNQLEFLDTVYEVEESVKRAIETFLYASKEHMKRELSLNYRTRRDADKIL